MKTSKKLFILFIVELLVTFLPFVADAGKRVQASKTLITDPSADFNDDDKSLIILRLQKSGQWQEIKDRKIESTLDGGHDVGGGNSYEAEFKSIGALLLQNLKGSADGSSQVDLLKFERALNEVRIVATKDRLILNGSERDAINSRSRKIIFLVESRWQKLSLEQKKILVMHEYLRFCDVNDTYYSVSSKLAALQTLTLIPPAVGNIYHQIELPKDVWSFEDGEVVSALVDKEKQNIRVAFTSEESGLPVLIVTVSDPVLNGKNVYYGTRTSEELFDPNELAKGRRCHRKMKEAAVMTTFVVGERAMNIVDCWGPGEKR